MVEDTNHCDLTLNHCIRNNVGLLNNADSGLASMLTHHVVDGRVLRQLRGHCGRQDVLHQVTDETVRHLARV